MSVLCLFKFDLLQREWIGIGRLWSSSQSRSRGSEDGRTGHNRCRQNGSFSCERNQRRHRIANWRIENSRLPRRARERRQSARRLYEANFQRRIVRHRRVLSVRKPAHFPPTKAEEFREPRRPDDRRLIDAVRSQFNYVTSSKSIAKRR